MVFVTQRAILRFFATQGRYVVLMRVKFGMEEWTKVYFTSIDATIMV